MQHIRKTRDIIVLCLCFIAKYLFDCVRDVARPLIVGHQKREAFRITRFVPIGIATTVLGGIFVAPILYVFGRAGFAEAGMVASMCSWIPNFLGHRHVTFCKLNAPWDVGAYQQLAWFALLKWGNLGYVWLILDGLVEERRWDWAVVFLAPIPCWNYMLNRWNFAGQSPLQLYRLMKHDVVICFCLYSPPAIQGARYVTGM